MINGAKLPNECPRCCFLRELREETHLRWRWLTVERVQRIPRVVVVGESGKRTGVRFLLVTSAEVRELLADAVEQWPEAVASLENTASRVRLLFFCFSFFLLLLLFFCLLLYV